MLENIDLFFLSLCNQAVAYSQWAFFKALYLSNYPAWMIAACALTAIYFSSGKRQGNDGYTVSRKSIRRVLLLFSALVLSFVSARILGALFNRPRPMLDTPLQIPIDPAQWAEIKSFLEMQGAFPSDHAAMFAVVTVGVFLVSRFWGWVALAVNLFFVVLRIGVGFHWPSDMLAGELIGIAMVFLLLRLEKQVYVDKVMEWAGSFFDRYPVIAYPLAFLVLLDFTQKFNMLFTLLAEIAHVGGVSHSH